MKSSITTTLLSIVLTISESSIRNIKDADNSVPLSAYLEDQHLMSCWREAREILKLTPADRLLGFADYSLESDDSVVEIDDEIDQDITLDNDGKQLFTYRYF